MSQSSPASAAPFDAPWSYRPGSWYAVIGTTTTLVLPADQKSSVIDLWALLDGGGEFDDVLDALLGAGLSRLPAFALIGDRPDGGVRVLLRGTAVRAEMLAADETVHLQGVAGGTWAERSFDELASLRLDLDDASDGPDLELPIVTGLVRLVSLQRPAHQPDVEKNERPDEEPREEILVASEDLTDAGPPTEMMSPLALVEEPEDATEPEAASEAASEPEAEPEVDPLLHLDDPLNDPLPEPEPEPEPEPADPADWVSPPVASVFDDDTRPPAPSTPPPSAPPSAPPSTPPSAPPTAVPDEAETAVDLDLALPPAPETNFAPPPPPPYPPSAAPQTPPPPLGIGSWEPVAGFPAPVADTTSLPAAASPPDPASAPEPPATSEPASTAPAVATLMISDGQTVPVDRVVLIGRAPEARRFTSTDQPRLVSVPSRQHEISSTHIEVRPGTGADHGSAVVTDMGSTNGTVLVQPGLGPEDLKPGIAVQLLPGAIIDLGDGITIQVSRP